MLQKPDSSGGPLHSQDRSNYTVQQLPPNCYVLLCKKREFPVLPVFFSKKIAKRNNQGVTTWLSMTRTGPENFRVPDNPGDDYNILFRPFLTVGGALIIIIVATLIFMHHSRRRSQSFTISRQTQAEQEKLFPFFFVVMFKNHDYTIMFFTFPDSKLSNPFKPCTTPELHKSDKN